MSQTTKSILKKKNILIAAGGTAGHIIPALSLSRTMLQNGYNVNFITDSKFHNYSKSYEGIEDHDNFYTYILNAQGYSKKNVIKAGFKFIVNVFKLRRYIRKHKISAIVGFGGYCSLPAVIAGFTMLKKVFIHEQNTVMGMANRLSLPFVNAAFTFFPNVQLLNKAKPKYLNKMLNVGNPLRQDIKELHFKCDINDRFHGDEKRIFIMGGSQGAGFLNHSIPKALSKLPANIKSNLTVLHQCGSQHLESTEAAYKDTGIKSVIVKSFIDNVGEEMLKATAMISRSGAGAIAELTALGVPSILVPLPTSANDHQLFNANFLSSVDAAITVTESNIDYDIDSFASKIGNLINSRSSLVNMSTKAMNVANVEADVVLASSIEHILFDKLINQYHIRKNTHKKVKSKKQINK